MLTVRSTINIASQTVPPIIPVVQGDTGRAILFTLADFTIPAGASATYYVQKPSGEAVYNNATIDGNNVLVELTAQSIIEKGDNYGQVRIIVGEDVVTSFDFILLVKEFRGIDAVQSLTEMNIFDKAVEQAADAIDEVKTDALEAIDDAKDEAIEEVTSNFDLKLDASSTKGVQNQVITQAINTVNNAIGDLSGETVTPTATNNYGIGGSVGQVIETWATTDYWHGIYTVTAGNTYGITTVSDFPQQIVVWFTNSSNVILEIHKAFGTDHVEMVCTAPTGATKLFVMSYGYDAYHGTVQKVEPLAETVSNLKDEISDVCSKSLLNGYDKNSVEATNGYWRNTDGTFVASDNYTACNKYAEVKPNTEYSSWYSSGLDSRYTYVCFYDNQKNFISGSVLASSNIITSPANAKYVRVSSVRERVDTYVFCEGTTYNGYHDFGYFITLNDDVNVPNLQEVLEELETFEYTTTDSVGYMTYQGVIDTSQTSFVSKTTDNIPCKEGEIYEYVGDGRWSAYSYVIYNVNGSIIARGQIAGSDRITIPANAVSVKFSSFINATQAEEAPLTVRKISPLTLAEKVENNVYDIENLKSAGESLNGLKIDILGDSWSAVNDTASVKYTNLLASRDNMLVNVLAYSGSGFSLPTSANKPFYVQAQSIRADTDIVFIFGSFNDISAIVSGVQIGDVTDTGTSTICGCINTTIDNILEVNPFAKIIVATPGAWAGYNAGGEGGNPNMPKALEYVEAIKNVCFKRGYPCVDMLRTLNLKPWVESFRTAYQPDGTHPNNVGHLKYVYPRVKAVLKEFGA